ncbi:MAG: TIGR00282 family metallophosphoesterase [Candidatus Omnitrophica bacterium]|nr:2',3'-cyclic-nucleotide 2'-phosphodiesterase [bacterium]NUN96106.1 TIGR00282 family metallophosphoesterase [Candidatus Omnitrophota bacterium]
MRILFVGDVFGKPGRRILKHHLEWLKEELRVDACIANVENAAAGKGLTPPIAEELFAAGVDLMTMGNHGYDNKGVFELYNQGENRIVRPLNYAADSPGPSEASLTTPEGVRLTVIQVQGRVFMNPTDSPFTALDRYLVSRPPGALIVDVHAEATSEKQALGWYLDGRVTAVIGTHTHVQSADERILPKGTAMITDVGMTGPHDSIIGGDIQQMLRRFLTQLPTGLEVAKGNPKIHAVLIETDPSGRRTERIERHSFAEADLNRGALPDEG